MADTELCPTQYWNRLSYRDELKKSLMLVGIGTNMITNMIGGGEYFAHNGSNTAIGWVQPGQRGCIASGRFQGAVANLGPVASLPNLTTDAAYLRVDNRHQSIHDNLVVSYQPNGGRLQKISSSNQTTGLVSCRLLKFPIKLNVSVTTKVERESRPRRKDRRRFESTDNRTSAISDTNQSQFAEPSCPTEGLRRTRESRSQSGSHRNGRVQRRTKSSSDAIIPVRIGLAQSNLETGYQRLMEVSHPSSPNYGKHLSHEEVVELFAPKKEASVSVQAWLTGDSPGIDVQYPNAVSGGFNQTQMCGASKPAKVISFSYSTGEANLPPNHVRRQCNEFMKLGLQGTTFIFSSGDYGVATSPGDVSPSGCTSTAGQNGTIFTPQMPMGCPYSPGVPGLRPGEAGRHGGHEHLGAALGRRRNARQPGVPGRRQGARGVCPPGVYAHPEVFNDVVNGSNPNCGSTGFAAVPGWDPVTGMGTPKYPELVKLFLSLP
ncbi:uncharacterized protein PG986_001166 [Apiospora aurea]|uniref:Peptidase S53 activation domain-containing protein n=1 Tax=Apiospora aurea TaxID=335848 RepID=A0ABR1QW62_9PEZI